MIENLKKVLENAYAPYSNYHVAAAVVMADGKRFYGVNVENASYGATICAERNAINTAITYGYKKDDFLEIHIMNSTNKKGMPCMMCRQVFVELLNPNVSVFVYDKNGNFSQYKVKDLCPYPFSEDDLK